MLHHEPHGHASSYFVDVMEALECHQDLQLADDNGALRSYATKYVSKFSEAMADELLNDEAPAENLAISVLTKYKPYEPEMVLQLFGARFRQWALSSASGGKVDVDLSRASRWPSTTRTTS